jgi:hypothetical protein
VWWSPRRLGGDAIHDQAPPQREPLGGLAAVYHDVLSVEDVAPRVPHVLEGVHDATLVLRPLEDVTVPRSPLVPHLPDHLLHLVPGLGGLGEAALLEEVLAVVEHPRVREPRYAPDLALVVHSLQRPVEVVVLLPGGKAVGEVEDPAVCGELRGPDHIPPMTSMLDLPDCSSACSCSK